MITAAEPEEVAVGAVAGNRRLFRNEAPRFRLRGLAGGAEHRFAAYVSSGLSQWHTGRAKAFRASPGNPLLARPSGIGLFQRPEVEQQDLGRVAVAEVEYPFIPDARAVPGRESQPVHLDRTPHDVQIRIA